MEAAQDYRESSVRARAARGAATASGASFDWTFILLCTWLTGGIFLDGWAHNHGKVDQSFFTPWHAILYSGYLAVAIFFVATILRNHARGAPWRRSYPSGYGAAVIGVPVFAVAGVGDLLWHTLFGIEKGVEGLVSPSHLGLALGATLILTGPLRAAWRRSAPDAAERWRTLLPALLALTYIFSLLVFFTQFAQPIVKSRANLQITDIVITYFPFDTSNDPNLSAELGIASILLQAAIMAGIALVLVRRWRLPLGTFALLFGLNGLLISFLAGRTSIIGVMLVSAFIGLLVDALNVALRPTPGRAAAMRAFGFSVPFIYNLIYFAALYVTYGEFGWSVHLWTGAIVMAGIVGLLLSFLVVPPQMPAQTPLAGD
ncbi:MAG TPA: hypothetical protein VFU69_17480 [Ktedonobacterales bacterium]|nr:hypothetical protein [Ktedonobacterales bacterium]